MVCTLPMVEALLHEFYLPGTQNARKHEIETQLVAFKQQADAGGVMELCLRVATTSNAMSQNEFLWFFATSTLDHVITRRWSALSAADRAVLRETLWQTYARLSVEDESGGVGGGARQRDTYGQLIALMGKREFPHEDANYVVHLVELIKTKFPLGINLLRVTSEEIVSNRGDLTTERKNYFHSCFSMCIPDIMDLLTKLLLIVVCYINGKDVHSIPNTLMDYSLLSTLPNDYHLSSYILDLLYCIQHLTSWIRTEHLSEYFLMSIFDLSQWRTDYPDISMAALSVLNELLYLQKPIPYAPTLMNGVNGLLEQHNQSAKLQGEMYVDKLRELLRWYAMKYWPKLLQENEMLERFLKSLYSCTIYKNGALDFTEKLEIWTPVIKGLVANPLKMQHYKEIVDQLVAEIMRRIQFEYNKAELELLENEFTEEDNAQTEWHQYLSQCIECIALVGESRPNAAFVQVFSHWSRPHLQLQSIEHDIDCGKSLELARKLKCSSFNENLRDFSTVCQAVVRIAPMLNANANADADLCSDVNGDLQLLTENLLSTLKFFTSSKLAMLNVDKSSFQSDLDYLYAQVLMAIQSILSLSLIDFSKSQEILRMLSEAIGGILLSNPNSSPAVQVAPIVYLAASQLLLCIASGIRPKCLLELPSVMSLMQSGPRLTHLPRQAIANIYISLFSYLALPWKNIDDQQQQDFPRRCALLREYIECLSQSLLEVDLGGVNGGACGQNEAKIATIVKPMLGTFSLVVDFFKDSSNTTKEMLANTLKRVITKSLEIYNVYGCSSNTIALATASFSLSILRSLQTQLGSQFIRDMVTLFINVCNREQLTPSRLAVVEKVLQMFQLIVEQPGSASMAMLPSILDLTIKQIVPLLQCEPTEDNGQCDIANTVYTLFDSILNHKWQYFYKSHIQVNGSMQQISSGNLQPEHFMAILNSYGQVLVTGNDPNVRRNVLVSLQNVNDRWRLYQRPIFMDHLLDSFQSALISVLLSGEGSLHFDLLANALFAMGQVDTFKLRESFATAGFPINLKIIDDICLSTDIPTFSQKLTQLIQDAHCVNFTQQST